jgi:DNA gyrase subunit A
MSVKGVSEQGRATQGVKLIRLDENDAIAAITKLDNLEGETNGAEINGSLPESGAGNGAAGEIAGPDDGAESEIPGPDAGTPAE